MSAEGEPPVVNNPDYLEHHPGAEQDIKRAEVRAHFTDVDETQFSKSRKDALAANDRHMNATDMTEAFVAANDLSAAKQEMSDARIQADATDNEGARAHDDTEDFRARADAVTAHELPDDPAKAAVMEGAAANARGDVEKFKQDALDAADRLIGVGEAGRVRFGEQASARFKGNEALQSAKDANQDANGAAFKAGIRYEDGMKTRSELMGEEPKVA